MSKTNINETQENLGSGEKIEITPKSITIGAETQNTESENQVSKTELTQSKTLDSSSKTTENNLALEEIMAYVFDNLMGQKMHQKSDFSEEFKLIQQRITAGENIDLTLGSERKNFTPTMLAVLAGDLEMLSFLYEKKAKLEKVDSENNTLLHLATRNSNPLVFFFLILAVSDHPSNSFIVNKKNDSNQLALQALVTTNYSSGSKDLDNYIVRILLKLSDENSLSRLYQPTNSNEKTSKKIADTSETSIVEIINEYSKLIHDFKPKKSTQLSTSTKVSLLNIPRYKLGLLSNELDQLFDFKHQSGNFFKPAELEFIKKFIVAKIGTIMEFAQTNIEDKDVDLAKEALSVCNKAFGKISLYERYGARFVELNNQRKKVTSDKLDFQKSASSSASQEKENLLAIAPEEKILEKVDVLENQDDQNSTAKTTSKKTSKKRRKKNKAANLDLSEEVTTTEESINSSLESLEIKAEEEVKKSREEERRQVREFLAGSRQIGSVDNLPSFLQPMFRDLLANNYEVSLKGSAIYQDSLNRIPGDLDIEISKRRISRLPNQTLQNFIEANFGLSIDSKNIYRKEADEKSGGAFTINQKDHFRYLDFSFYDSDLPPPPYLSWTTNREKKITFDSNGQATKTVPSDCKNYAASLGINADENFLIINPRARGLILRLCFLQTIGVINAEEVKLALGSMPNQKPLDLVFRELKLDKLGYLGIFDETKKSEHIKNHLNNFVENHSFNSKDRNVFLLNLSAAVTIKYNPISDKADQEKLPFFNLLNKTIEELQKELRSNAPTTEAPDSNFLPLESEKILKSVKQK